MDSNNILGIEYLKALMYNNSIISPNVVLRKGEDYNSVNIVDGVCSATAIRQMLNDDKVQEEISMNMIANIMGLGNAATPLGLKAMQSLQKKNKDKKRLSNSMAMLIVINTASIQIIPTTVMAVRHSLGSENTSKIILPIWIATIVVAIFVVAISKTLMKKY